MEKVDVLKKTKQKKYSLSLPVVSLPCDTCRLLWPGYHSNAKWDQISGLNSPWSAAQRLYRPARQPPSTTED